ncbi:hypothetical protein C7974DRAFT_410984 [Boeremia exigua]|uniref:uncharacterized protein n=1 Tax=Boeremia exigua TaxID=749465 RepID=UPI001E8E4CA4|nr:uncharacterized protein C7974DRAFT_410984 [Boeremia exigua]KAH6637507.1 hypothetical protein C7974DRAFT_410984 [Boeremia exigua]
MAHPVTEIAYLPIKDGVDLNEGDSKRIWDATLHTISQQSGFKSLRWGVQIEHPGVAQMAIEWDSIDAHRAFTSAPSYTPFLESLDPLLSAPPHIFHLSLPPSPHAGSSPFDAPVTECVSLYFDPATPPSAYDASFAAFVAEGAKVTGVVPTGMIGGWGVEAQKADDEGEEMRFFGVFIGWESVQAHMDFRASKEFPGVAKYLREGVGKAKMHHVALKRYGA